MIQLDFQEKYDINLTFSCGQIFRFQSFDRGASFYGPLEGRIIKITQKNSHSLLIESHNEKELKSKLNRFFRMGDNYIEMQKSVAIDSLMKKIVKKTDGLHLLNQDPFECIIAFLLSQCSNIPRITHHLNQLSEKFGKKILFDEKIFYLFPKRNQLLEVTEQDFRDLGFGYRAKYIYPLIQNFPDFLITPPKDSKEFNKKLKDIYGIGQKVADCIQLFGYGDLNWFPVDVWIQKFLQQHYFPKQKISNAKLAAFGRKTFGKWAGYAQELIYHYSRNFCEY